MLTGRDEMRLKRAISSSPKNAALEKLRQRTEKLREQEETRRQRNSLAFRMWERADKLLEQLERQRDENMPKTSDEVWNKQFSTAVELIPAARDLARNLWLDYIQMKGGD